jgi:hypothetical protein
MFQPEKDRNEYKYLIPNLLINARNTLPNEIIKFFCNNNYLPAKFEEIVNNINPIYDSLRNMDNKKYSKNMKKAILSTLTSLDLFLHDYEHDLYILDKLKAINCLSRTQKKKRMKKEISCEIKIEHENSKNYNKDNNKEDIKDNINDNIYESNLEKQFLGKKRKTIFEEFKNTDSSKYIDSYELLDELLEKYISILHGNIIIRDPFSKMGNILEFIDKVNNKETFEGILICFNFFKPILKEIFLNKDSFIFQNLIFDKLNNEEDDLLKKLFDIDKDYIFE